MFFRLTALFLYFECYRKAGQIQLISHTYTHAHTHTATSKHACVLRNVKLLTSRRTNTIDYVNHQLLVKLSDCGYHGNNVQEVFHGGASLHLNLPHFVTPPHRMQGVGGVTPWGVWPDGRRGLIVHGEEQANHEEEDMFLASQEP